MALTNVQGETLKKEGVETITSIADFIQAVLGNIVTYLKLNPVALVIGFVVLGMVRNTSGGIKLGKNFEIKM